MPNHDTTPLDGATPSGPTTSPDPEIADTETVRADAATPEEEEATSLQAIFEALGAQGRAQGKAVDLYLFRLRGGGDQEFLTRIPADDFDLEGFRSVYGGGKYLARVKAGARWAKGSHTFLIAGRPRDPDTEPTPAILPRTDPAPDPVIRELARMADRVEKIVTELRSPPAPAYAVNPLELTLSIIGAMQTATKPFQDALLATKGGGVSMKDLMDTFLQGVEMGRDQSAAPAESFSGVVREIMPQVLSAIQSPQQMGPRMLLNPPERHAPPPGRPAWVVWIEPHIPTLLKWAQTRKNPTVRAEMILDEIPADILPTFLDLVGRGDTFIHEMILYFPDLDPYRSWLTALAQAIEASYEWTDDAAPDDPDAIA